MILNAAVGITSSAESGTRGTGVVARRAAAATCAGVCPRLHAPGGIALARAGALARPGRSGAQRPSYSLL